MRDIPCFQGGLRRGRCTNFEVNQTNLNRVILPQFRQFRQVTWDLTSADVRLTSDLTWQLSVDFHPIVNVIMVSVLYTIRVLPLTLWDIRKRWNSSLSVSYSTSYSTNPSFLKIKRGMFSCFFEKKIKNGCRHHFSKKKMSVTVRGTALRRTCGVWWIFRTCGCEGRHPWTDLSWRESWNFFIMNR